MAVSAGSSKTFVLVHGAWHGGWCWRRVADALQARGHKVYTPTMSGLGERSHRMDERVNLATHIADIVNVIKWERLDDVVLCGHSYGGQVISGVAEHMQPAIASMVFVDAFVPENGDSLYEKGNPRMRGRIDAAREQNSLTMPAPEAAFFGVNEKDRAWVDAMCTPHPVATFVDKIALNGAREKVARKTYIRAKAYDNPAFDAAVLRLKGNSAWRVIAMDCGHDIMVDEPVQLADILEAA